MGTRDPDLPQRRLGHPTHWSPFTGVPGTMEHGEEVFRHGRILGVEETGTSQNALFPFGRRLMQHDHFLGGKITATFRLDLMRFVSTKSKKFQNTYHQNSILLQKKREFYPRLIKQFCRRILTVLFLHPS